MAKQSLAAKEGILTATGVKLPAMFQDPQQPVVARFVAPYITFAHPKRADEWSKIRSKWPNVNEGEMYLITNDSIDKCDRLKVGWLAHRQYWSHNNEAGTMVIGASWKEMPHPYKEHVESVILVYKEDSIVVANMQFRSTKCPAAKTMSDAFMASSTPEWAEESPQHKETLVCPHNWMRFYGEITLSAPRTSKTSGHPYTPAVATVHPTSVSEWRLLSKFWEDPSTQKALDDAAERFQFRLAKVAEKAGKL